MKYPNLISASAGSGKTYTLTEIIFEKIRDGEVKPEEIIATTFTVKAANEIKSRVREKLISEGRVDDANRINAALIGTLNSIALKLVQRFAIEIGISPTVETIADDEQQIIINEIIGSLVTTEFLDLATKLNQQEGFNSNKPIWISHIESIISTAKSNMISGEQFDEMAQNNIDEFRKLIPNIGSLSMEEYLPRVSSKLLALLDMLEYSSLSATNKGFYSDWETISKSIINKDYDYNSIIKLNGVANLPKKYHVEVEAEDLCSTLSKLTMTDEFQADYETYITSCFSIAKAVIKSYRTIKDQKGLLDFADQEALIYEKLCDSDRIRTILSEEYKLLIWDEFQDSSPLQAGILFKLTEIIENTYCLLDNKQSIYAFRGASPQLISGITNQIPPSHKSQLSESYRSNHQLVNFANALFTPIFDMDDKEIALQAADTKITKRSQIAEDKEPARINVWRFEKGNKAPVIKDYNIAMINQLVRFVKAGHQVFDKRTLSYRPVEYGDILVLVRTNSTRDQLAKLLIEANIPTSASGTGLCSDPEIIYITALLKLLVYSGDTLAKAEILLHTVYDGDQEAMINDRLKSDTVYTWQKENELWDTLKQIKSKTHTLSLTKVLHLLYEELDLGTLFSSWGNLPQRLANFEALLKHTQAYEAKCTSLNQGSSILGLLAYLDDLAKNEDDEKGEYLGSALRILTYHASKGLEANIVVLWDLQKEMRNKYYGVNSYGDEHINLDNILEQRSIGMRISPFDNSRKEIPGWKDLVEESEEMQAAIAQAKKEEQRLLYVGVTRARDYLIWGMQNVANKTKNYTCEEMSPLLNFKQQGDGIDKSTFVYNDTAISISFQTFPTGKGIDLDIQHPATAHRYFPSNTGQSEYPPLYIRPSDSEEAGGSVNTPILLHNQLQIDTKGITDKARGDFFHAVFAAVDSDTDRHSALAIIKHTATVYGLDDRIEYSDVYTSIIEFYKYLTDNYPTNTLYRELPIKSKNNEAQYISGYVDFLVETKDHLILIDFKSFCTPEWNEGLYKKKTLSFSTQLDTYADILSKSFNKPVKEKAIYFCIMGKMIGLGN